MQRHRKQRDIAARRVSLGLTQKALGEIAGYDQPTVSRAERNLNSPEAQRLVEVLDELESYADENGAQADAFWSAAESAQAPHAETILRRIAAIADTLLSGSLADVGLGVKLAECLPKSARDPLLPG